MFKENTEELNYNNKDGVDWWGGFMKRTNPVFRCAWKKLLTVKQNRELTILIFPGRLEKSIVFQIAVLMLK